MHQEEASKLVSNLFETWAPSLYQYACRESRSPLIAEDLVQEAFFSLYRELRDGRTIENPKAWTTTVVQFQARKFRRDEGRHTSNFNQDALLDFLPAKPGIVDSKMELVSELFSTLSQREEQVILLRLECLKYREIANRIGISAKSVATLLARALKKMQAARQNHVRQQNETRTDRNARKALR